MSADWRDFTKLMASVAALDAGLLISAWVIWNLAV